MLHQRPFVCPAPNRQPIGRFGPVRRVALADVVYEDRWGQPLPILGSGSIAWLDQQVAIPLARRR